MENIDDYIEEDATAEERAAAEEVLAGLQALRLQDKVQTAAAARQALKRAQWWRRILSALTILLLGFLTVWWLLPRFNAGPPTEPESTEVIEAPTHDAPPTINIDEEAVPTEETANPPTTAPVEDPIPPQAPPVKEEAPTTSPPMPIAEATLPPPAYPAPNSRLRGTPAERDEHQIRMDQVWYTSYPLTGLELTGQWSAVDTLLRERSFPRAYVALQRLSRELPGNDTLQYLQAYTTLEMGQGQAAAQMMEGLIAVPSTWRPQLRWLQALSLLLATEEEKAMNIMVELASDRDHPYQPHASKVLRMWEEE